MDTITKRFASLQKRLQQLASVEIPTADMDRLLRAANDILFQIDSLETRFAAPSTDTYASEDFDIDSSDEAELLNASDLPVPTNGTKRVSEEPNADPVAKRIRSEQYDAHHDLALSVLRERFTLQSFRLKQQQAISRLLAGQSAVVVFPTGGGKSLCYQLPALCFRELDKQQNVRQGYAESDITLVVSPLIALMKDQVDALRRRGINAAVLNSTCSKEEYLAVQDSMRDGSLDLLYCAPERLNNEGFVGSMANVRGGVRLLAVDEAHCISEWGHAFRPDYLKVARFAKEVGAERVVCLTATATPTVAADVCKAFAIPTDEGLFRTTTYRSNLRLLARSFKTKQESYPHLISFLRAHSGPTIIYVTLQKHTEQLATTLQGQGFRARPFHAGMPQQEKAVCQDAFLSSNDMIIVATIAFGMGIDKANIRNVIHYDIPRSLEGYSQEVGRAGRDGKQSHCMLFLCAEDLHLRESFARGDLPSKSSVSALLNETFSIKPTLTDRGSCIEVKLREQSTEHDIKVSLPGCISLYFMLTGTSQETVLKSIFAQLELRFELYRETTPKYTSYSYQLKGNIGSDRSSAAQAVKNHAKAAKTWTHIDVDAAARKSGVSRTEIVTKLNDWHDQGQIELKTGGVVNIYRLMKNPPSSAAEKTRIIDELYKELEAREQQEMDRMAAVFGLINGSACFAKTLAAHFGDTLPDGANRCGHCSFCETDKPVPVVTPTPKAFDQKPFDQVLRAVPDRDDPRFLARVAFGIGSPRITKAKLGSSAVFGSMEEFDFMVSPNNLLVEETVKLICSGHCLTQRRKRARLAQMASVVDHRSSVRLSHCHQQMLHQACIYFEHHDLHQRAFAVLSVNDGKRS